MDAVILAPPLIIEHREIDVLLEEAGRRAGGGRGRTLTGARCGRILRPVSVWLVLALVALHLPGAVLLVWLLHDLGADDGGGGSGGGRRQASVAGPARSARIGHVHAWAQRRGAGAALIDAGEWVAAYLRTAGDRPVLAQVSPGEIAAALPEHAPAG